MHPPTATDAPGRATGRLQALPTVFRRHWRLLAALGVVYYTVTRGTQFLVLVYLPAAMFSLLLNFSVIVVALLGIRWLGKALTWRQGLGLLVAATGIAVVQGRRDG